MGGAAAEGRRPSFSPPLLAPEAPGPGLRGRSPPRKAGGSGGREPPPGGINLISLVADFTDGVTNETFVLQRDKNQNFDSEI